MINFRPVNFGVVEAGLIYRSGQPNAEKLANLINTNRLSTIIILRSAVPDFEKEMADRYCVMLHHLKMTSREPPPDELVEKFLSIVTDIANMPLLLHCRAGADRTGLMVGILRAEIYGWPLKQIRREMIYFRHMPIFKRMPLRYLKDKYFS